MSIISAVIGATAASSELPPLNITDVNAYWTSNDEGDTINITPIAENFRNQTVYWTVVYGPDVSSSNFTASTGTYVVSGSSSNFYVSTIADSITQGHAWTFGINLGTTVGGSDLWTGTNTMVTINDTSRTPQTPALVLDLDPANLDVFWTDTSGMHNDASITGIVPSGDNGGVFGFDGVASYANVPTLTTSTFSSVSVSAWFNPSSIGSDQVIISKELTYKLMISADGRIAWMVKSSAGGSWSSTIFAAAGLVTTSTWSHVAATVDSNATKIYINGVLAETGSGLTLGTNDKRVVIGASDDNGITVSGYFGGRMGRVEMWNYAITATSVLSYYNSTAARYGQSLIPQSLSFNGTQGQPLFVNGSPSDWALGTSGTIEWWEKINRTAVSFGGNFNGGILVQGNQGTGLGANGIDIFAAGTTGTGINSNVGGNVTTSWPELTTGTWIHVAMAISSGLQQYYYNGIAQTQTDGNRSVNLQNALDTLRVGNRVPDANYQNFTGLISNLHISTATLYTGNFTPMIRTATTTGTVLLLDYYNPTVDLSYYELNGLNASADGLINLYFSTSTYPNLINQIQVGNILSSFNTSTTATVTGAVFLADPANWGVPVTNVPNPGPFNFRGARHTTTGTVTLTTDGPV